MKFTKEFKIKKNKENQFSSNSIMMDKCLKVIKNDRSQLSPTFRICDTDHDTGSQRQDKHEKITV
jgi:hypothetical protein